MAKHNLHTISATVTGLAGGATQTLDVVSGNLTLDDSWSPYVQGSLVCTAPADSVIETIDPRLTQRVTVVVTENFGTGTQWNPTAQSPVSRTFNLALRARAVSAVDQTMTLTLESDESLLQDFTKITTTAERTYGLSVRTAVAYALAKIGATLVSGTDDYNLTTKALDPVYTNLLPNPSVEVNTTGYNSYQATMARSTAKALVGTASVLATPTTTSGWQVYTDLNLGAPTNVPVTVGASYTFSFYVQSAVAAQSYQANIRWINSSGGAIGSDTVGTVVSAPVGSWVQVTATGTAPTGATHATGLATCVGPTYSTSYTAYLDAFMFTATSTLIPYFDGANSYGRDATIYVHAWTGTANASTSTLTEQPNNDATIWLPGVSGWDWVSPMVQAGGLYLYCDEARNWYLVKAVSVAGIVSISSLTGLTAATDTIDLQNNSQYYTAVVIQYNAPSDPITGLTPAPQYDVAGAAGPTLSITYDDTVYPGPGAAAAVLARAAGKGRTFDITTESQYGATPGQQLAISIPNGTTQSGSISSVTWSLPDGTMTVGSTGLLTTPSNAWIEATDTWATSPTGSWATDL